MVRFGDRSDAELIELAQAGWAPAFAVLVHRHAALVRAAGPPGADPVAHVTSVFLAAMRELPARDPGAPVLPWLLGLAGLPTGTPPTPSPLTAGELDAAWAELARRWPDGRPPTRVVHWQRTAAVVGVAALAGLVPALVLGADSTDANEEPVEIRAVPVEDERVEVAEEEPDPDTLDFSFPTTPEEQDAEAGPAQEVEEPPTEQEPTEPESEPEPTDDGQDTGEDDGSGEDDDTGEDDGGPLDDLLGGDDEEAPSDDDTADGTDDSEDTAASDDASAEDSDEAAAT